MKVVIPVAAMMASVCNMADRDVRYYLNGVFVEATRKETRAVATNGHCVTVIRYDAENDLGELDRTSFIIPDNAVKKMKGPRSFRDNEIVITIPDDPLQEFRADCCAFGTEVFNAVDGKYPDYRSVFPRDIDEAHRGKAAQFQPEYLVAMKKAVRIWADSKYLTIHQNGQRAGIVRAPGFLGIVMPLREDATESRIYSADLQWVQER